MARTKITPHQGKRGGEMWGTTDKGSYEGRNKGEEAIITGAPPTPAKEAPPKLRRL